MFVSTVIGQQTTVGTLFDYAMSHSMCKQSCQKCFNRYCSIVLCQYHVSNRVVRNLNLMARIFSNTDVIVTCLLFGRQ
jgi:enoyl-[acyl-carrier-protein] reductase (NADH)